MNPLVTLYILNFNYDKYLKTAIDSALNQTYKNIEHIIVDGISSDTEFFATDRRASLSVFQRASMSSATRLVLLFVSFVRFASSALWTRDCRVWRKGRRVCPRQTCRTERERRRKSVSVVSLGCFSRLFSYNLCTKRKKNLQIYVGKKAPTKEPKMWARQWFL